mgnify:CR=1 FL=1
MNNEIATSGVEARAKKWFIGIILLIIIASLIALLSGLKNQSNNQMLSPEKASACVSTDGKFDQQHNECGGINKAKCENIGGKFISCGSPCRHDKSAQACIEICESYCQL